MKHGSHLVLGSTLLAGSLAGVSALAVAAPGPKPGAAPSRSEPTVPSVLAARCLQCHGPQAQLGGLRLDSRAAALKGGQSGPSLVPGHPEKSLLVKAVHYDGKLKMPPPGKLADAEIKVLTDWIRTGAPWPAAAGQPSAAPNTPRPTPNTPGPLWAFQPIRKPKVPAVRMKSWVRTPIDAFVLAELERHGMKPSPYADRRTLIRRVSLDLIGLPPPPEEVEAFVSDRSPNAYEKVVDRLLASPHFGERMALHWLDQARYADSDGYHDDTDRTQWGYRDYVINSFNADKPFNRFTVEQIAGDLLVQEELKKRGSAAGDSMWSTYPISSPQLTPDLQEILVGSAFNRSGPTTSEGGAIPEEVLNAYAVDRVNTTANVWLGLTVQCTQCHDHKYDPLTSRDFYQLAAYFNQVPEQALYRGADAPPTILYPTADQRKQLAEWDQKIAALEVEFKPQAGAPDAKAEEARVAAVKKKLEEARAARTAVLKNATLRVMVDVPKRRPTHLLMRGDYRNPGEEVQPTIPAVFGKLPSDRPQNRLALAEWLVDPKQPLTPRVTVNRFWQLFFGTGIVKSSEDFGTRGERPSHPELLDWLAGYFVSGEERGKRGEENPPSLSPHSSLLSTLSSSPSTAPEAWSVKRLLKLIVMSSTYQQSSRSTPELRAKDPENRLLARGPRFRLSAELIRDNALAISGLLEPKIGGPSVKPYQPGDLWRELSSGDQAAKSYIQDHGADLYRRGLYVVWKRSVLYPAFAVFDASKRETCVLRRPITNTPLQAFVTLNDTTYVEAARVFAQRVLKEGGPTLPARLDYALRRALGRPATTQERAALSRVYQTTLAQYRTDTASALQLVSVGEAVRPADLDVPELAAWTCVCNTLLNLDETITKE